jgi:hypothetical protein
LSGRYLNDTLLVKVFKFVSIYRQIRLLRDKRVFRRAYTFVPDIARSS